MSTPLLHVSDLHAGYGRACVLHGLSLRVMPGEVVALIGPNGAGKTTALHAVMRLIPGEGVVHFDGDPLAGAATEALVARGFVLVPETRALFTDMTVTENLLLGAHVAWRAGSRDLDARLRDVHALFPRLAERARQRAGTLSGGERQMLALGRALMSRPRMLLLDEPSLGLAPRVVRDIFAVLARLRADGLSVLLVEQNARAALALADRGVVLETGTVTAAGPSAVLAADPRLLATYLGERRQETSS